MIDWALGALVITAASFVQGLAGFGIGLVGLAFLPYLMSPATAIVLLTLYAAPFTLGVFIQLRDDFRLSGIRDMLVGTVLGTPIGVWGLAALPASLINRLPSACLVAGGASAPVSCPACWEGRSARRRRRSSSIR